MYKYLFRLFLLTGAFLIHAGWHCSESIFTVDLLLDYWTSSLVLAGLYKIVF